jgi:hypothetical protein
VPAALRGRDGRALSVSSSSVLGGVVRPIRGNEKLQKRGTAASTLGAIRALEKKLGRGS